jgi:hypothetical protein
VELESTPQITRVAIGLVSLGRAAFSVQDRAWPSVVLLTVLGVVNLVIGRRHMRSDAPTSAPNEEEPTGTESRIPEWARNVVTGLIMFVGMALLLLILFGDPTVAVVMAAFVMGPITVRGAIVALRRRREGTSARPVHEAQPPS